MARKEPPAREPQRIIGFLGSGDTPQESWEPPLDNWLGNDPVGFIFPTSVRVKATRKNTAARPLEGVYDWVVSVYEESDAPARVADLVSVLAERQASGDDVFLAVLPDDTPETAVAIKEAGNAQITVLNMARVMDVYTDEPGGGPDEDQDAADEQDGSQPDRVPLTAEAAAEALGEDIMITATLLPDAISRIADAVIVKLVHQGLTVPAAGVTQTRTPPAASREADGTTAYWFNVNTTKYRLTPPGAGRPRKGEVKEYLTADEVARYTAEGKISDPK